MRIIIIFFAISLMVFSNAAAADCSLPDGQESQTRYDFSAHKLYYCNGTDWVESGGGSGSGGMPADCGMGSGVSFDGTEWQCSFSMANIDILNAIHTDYQKYLNIDNNFSSGRIFNGGAAFINQNLTADRTFDFTGVTLPDHANHTILWMGQSYNSTATMTPRLSGVDESGSTQIFSSNNVGNARWAIKTYPGQVTAHTAIGIRYGHVGNNSGNYMLGNLPGRWIKSSEGTNLCVVEPGNILLGKAANATDSVSATRNLSGRVTEIPVVYSAHRNWYGSVQWGMWVNNTNTPVTADLTGASNTNLGCITLRLLSP